jgi:putative FmdB family regulatory protein
MPIYEYSCPACGITFEEWVRSSGESDKTQICPQCGAEAPRMLSNTSFILKGEGWFASSYGNGTSNAFDKSNGVPPHGSKPAEEGSASSAPSSSAAPSTPAPKAESAPASSGDSAK